jgi:hypothetical protein
MIDYDANPSAEINLDAKLVNSADTTAAKAIIKVMTPDNDRVLFESESSISLDAGMETTVSISFTLPQINYSELLIFHTIYQLTDADGQTVLWDSESLTA